MLRFNLLWIGKTREKWIRQGIEEYRNRLSHYLTINITEIKERARSGSMSAEQKIKLEAGQITASLPRRNAYVIALDSRGTRLTSEGIASLLDRLERESYGQVCWVIGGAYGLAPEIQSRADMVFSLSDLTFTHDMTRVLLLEQLYRACTIRRGEKYHH